MHNGAVDCSLDALLRLAYPHYTARTVNRVAYYDTRRIFNAN